MRIININGPINAGKSTTSKLLQPKLPDSIFIEVDELMTDEEESSLGLTREEGWAERLKRLDKIIIQEKKLQRYENIVFAYPMTDNLYRQWKLWEDDNTKLICITLSPKIEVCLQNRGTRLISEDEKIRIKEMYDAGYHTSQFADLIIDNGEQKPEDTVKIILNYLNNTNKLIIWDFDGVIADSEKLWVSVWLETLEKEKNIKLSEEEKLNLLVGIADKNKKKNLENYFGMVLDDDFMQKINDGEIYKGTHFMQPIEGVEEVMSDNRFAHCIATGATKEQHAWKMTQFKWIEKYMSPQDYFTVDMVERGKPSPDLFLLAAQTKGHKSEECIIIGDSLNDLIAANTAKMKAVAFVGAEGNDTPEYRQKCKDHGAMAICSTMSEVKEVLDKLSSLKSFAF